MNLSTLPFHHEQSATDLKPEGAIWDSPTIEALLSALKQKTCITVGWPEQSKWVQSMVLGFDIESGEILLSEFCPSLPSHCLPEGKMYLQIPYQEGWMVMEAVLQSTHVTIVKAPYGSYTQNRRWQARVEFPMRAGPLARVSPKGTEQRESFIANISRGGCLLHCLGKDLRSQLTQGEQLPVTITFNEHFAITTHAKILSLHFLRSPCCHTQLRLAFSELEPEELYQLDSYISYHGYRFTPAGHRIEILH